jgi:hypothetical protein
MILTAAARHVTPVRIITSDVARFYRIYDRAKGHPTAEALQKYYIDEGSEGVRQFVPDRIVSGEAMAKEVAKDQALYDHARTCAAVLPQAKARLDASMSKLLELYPEASTPPVTVLIGRNNSGGTTGKSGVLIGLEVVCRPNSPATNPQDNLVHVVAHEYAHVQQPEPNGSPYVLRDSLREGVAELVAELTSGQISNGQLIRWTRGRENEIETAFLADAEKKDISGWLYNGLGTPEKPGDLGYWVGYRIAKAYYLRHRNKHDALGDLLKTRDPHRILRQSGWRPGIKLP